MSQTEILTLIALLFTFASLLLEVVNVTFNITWKISHENKENDKKSD